MGNELLDYKKQANFDFFKFGDSIITFSESSQATLKRDCEKVLETAHKTVRNFCELGVQLKKIHDSGRWQHVINPEDGKQFNYCSFEKFCEYAFGFSGTRTSNLLSLAKFLIEDENGGLKFVRERYEDFSTSQLIELAPVERWNRDYFTSDMTIAEMRLVKKYLKTDHCRVRCAREDFNLLNEAKTWERYEEMCKNAKPQPLPPADVIPGQIDLSEMEEIALLPEPSETPQECAAPISDYEEARQDVELSNEAEGFVETFEEPSSDSDENEEIISDVETREESPSVQSEYEPFELVKGMSPWFKHDFKNRDGIREFYFGYRNWEKLYSAIPFIDVYRYKFKIGTLYAVNVQQAGLLDEPSEREVKAVVRYYWQKKGDPLFCCYETSKIELETFIPLHKDEL